jgi:hypothetical protein
MMNLKEFVRQEAWEELTAFLFVAAVMFYRDVA